MAHLNDLLVIGGSNLLGEVIAPNLKIPADQQSPGATQLFPLFTNTGGSGNKDIYIHPRYYYWDTGTRAHLCVGEQGSSTTATTGAYAGGLTLNSGSGKGKYVDIITAAMTGHRTVTIPDASGTMLITGNYKSVISSNGLTAPITISSASTPVLTIASGTITSTAQLDVEKQGARTRYYNGTREGWVGFAYDGNYFGLYDATQGRYLIANDQANTFNSTIAIGGPLVAKGDTISVRTSGGTAAFIFDRGTSANWKLKNESAILKFDCDWDPGTNKKASYVTRFTLDTSGNLTLTGYLSTTKLITSNYGTSAPSGSATAGTLYFQII